MTNPRRGLPEEPGPNRAAEGGRERERLGEEAQEFQEGIKKRKRRGGEERGSEKGKRAGRGQNVKKPL